MREIVKFLGLTAAALAIAQTAEAKANTQDPDPNTLNVARHFVQYLIDLNPNPQILEVASTDPMTHLSQLASLVQKCEIDHVYPLSEGAIRVNFTNPCGSQWSYPLGGVSFDVERHSLGVYSITGPFMFHHD